MAERGGYLRGRQAPAAVSAPALGLALALAGCVAPTDTASPAPAPSTPTPDSGMTSTERLANDLAAAGVAFAEQDRASLTQHIRAIELAGARPSDARGEAELQDWRSALSPEHLPMRGRALGPAYLSGTLSPGGRMSTEQVMLGGKTVSVAAGTAPRIGVRLRIARADGNLVCERSPAHARECRFVPAFTQRYRIELLNSGKRNARYHIVFD